MGLFGVFGGKKKPNGYDGDGCVAIIPPLSPPRVPIDDGEGGLTLGFRDDKSRGAALEECTAGVVDRCVLGAAGGCAVSAARECERTVARPTSRNPLAFATGAFRSKEDKAREVGAANENYREAREACEAARRERCNAEAREVCEGHASGFCAAVLRGRGKLRLKLGAESELMEESDEEEQEEEEKEEEEEEDEEAKEQDRVSEKGKR